MDGLMYYAICLFFFSLSIGVLAYTVTIIVHMLKGVETP